MLKHRKNKDQDEEELDKEQDDMDSEEHISPLDLSDNSSLHTSAELTLTHQTFTRPHLSSTQIPLLGEHTAIRVSSTIAAEPHRRSTRRTHVPTLTEATLAESEVVEISGQGVDTLMSNIVASSYSDMAISQDGANPGLSFYVSDMPGTDSMVSGASTISMPSLMMPDAISSIADSDTWCATDQSET